MSDFIDTVRQYLSIPFLFIGILLMFLSYLIAGGEADWKEFVLGMLAVAKDAFEK